MTIKVVAWALDQQIVTSTAERFVLLGLSNHADENGCNAFPSVRTLARYTGLSQRAVQDALRRLQASGVICECRDLRVLEATVDRPDRRPRCYDITGYERGAGDSPRKGERGADDSGNGVQELHPNLTTKPSIPIGMEETTMAANGQSFTTRLSQELESSFGVKWTSYETKHQSVSALLRQALNHLPTKRHHGTSIGVISDYVRSVTGHKMTPQARSHTAHLVKTHKPLTVLDAYGQALHWGAGLAPAYASDPLSLSKYVAKILSARSPHA